MRLRWTDVFNENGSVRQNAFIHDQKIGKANLLYLKPAQNDLLVYQAWLQENHLISDWLFPSLQHPERHITEKQFYKIMSKVADLLGTNYLGTHTMRKTGAYRVYTQSNYNIGLVMNLLNHSSETMTLAFLFGCCYYKSWNHRGTPPTVIASICNINVLISQVFKNTHIFTSFVAYIHDY